MCPLKTIIFDMGNVLTFFSHEKMCRQIAQLCGCSTESLRQELIDSGLQWEFERGRIDEHQLKTRLEARYGCRLDLSELCRATADIFTLNSTIVPVLDELKRRGLRLVLLSNTCVTHVRFIQQEFDVLNRFDHLVLSFEVGAVKPEPAIYQAAIQAAECEPHEALYTDDISEYVEAGRSHGLNAVVFTTTEAFVNDLKSYDLNLEV
ncbi:MAG TPA: HAD family phosphatase [Planctomicrobium sp.]|nr:HAD family phosphatase [Planctomicrobium sp.]